MATQFQLNDPQSRRAFYDAAKMDRTKAYQAEKEKPEALAIDLEEETRNKELALLLRSDRQERALPDATAAEVASFASFVNSPAATLALRIADRDRAASALQAGATVESLVAAAAEMLRAKTSGVDVAALAKRVVDKKIDAFLKNERDEICREGGLFTDYVDAVSGAALNLKRRHPDRDPAVLDQMAQQRVDGVIEQKLADRRREHPATARALQKSAADDVASNERVDELFSKWIGLSQGSTMRELEAEIRKQSPDLSAVEVAERVDAQLKQLLKNCRLAWQASVPDGKIVEMLLRDTSPEARRVLAQYQARQARFESSSTAEYQLRKSDIETQDNARADQARKKERYIRELKRTRAGQDDDEEDPLCAGVEAGALSSLTDMRTTPLAVAVVEEPQRPEDSVVLRNSFSDPITPGVHSIVDYMAAYATNKSRSEGDCRGDLDEYMERRLVSCINLHYKMLASAPPDAVLARDGLQPTGNGAADLRALLRACGQASDYSYKTMNAYVRHWRMNYTKTPLDFDRALVARYRRRDDESLRAVMRNFGLGDAEIETGFSYGSRPETNAVLRQVMNAAQSKLFDRSQKQAMDATNLRGRVAAQYARDAKRRRVSRKKPADAADGDDVMTNILLAGGTPSRTAHPDLVVTLEECDRAYLQSFMREAVGNERECANTNCVAQVLAAQFPEMCPESGKGTGFKMREFLLPSEWRTFRELGKLPRHTRICVLCDRAAVTFAYESTLYNRTEPDIPLHDYKVRVDVEGEYPLEACLPITHGQGKLSGVVAPFVGFKAFHYMYATVEAGDRKVRGMIETSVLDFRLRSERDPRI